MASSSSSGGTDGRHVAAAPPDSGGREGEFIARLVRRRVASGLSQAEVARRMQTSQSAVARLESRHHDAQLSTLMRYAEALGLSLDLAGAGLSIPEALATGGSASSGMEGQAPRELAAQGGSPRTTASLAEALTQIDRQPSPAQGRAGRLKGSVPAVTPETPDKPDPDHVLTWRQRKVLQVIRDSVQKHGYPPSLREIGEAVGLTSTSSVSFQLSTLQRKGYLHRNVGRPRTVEVRLPGHPAVRPEQAANGTAPEA